MLATAREASERIAAEEGCTVSWEQIWEIEPILFDDGLIDLADAAIQEVAGTSERLPSGPLHDAAEMARVMPTVMLFVKSLGGVSHTKEEDTPDADLELSVRALYELTRRTLAWAEEAGMSTSIAESHLSNKDLAPTGPERRTWGTYNLAALWVGLSIVITTYTLASGLIAAGMSWWQGLLTVALGNLIVLVPILLNSHPGTKYGIPFPVLVRSSFGIRGANVAAMARALVACGWFGIQTWIGALALDTLMTTLTSGWADVERAQGDRLRVLLGAPGRDHPARHRGHQVPRELRRADAHRRQRRPADLGLRRRRQRVLRVVAARRRRRGLLDAVRPRPRRQRRLLDHAVDEHPGLHALREGPALAARSARASRCR